MTNKDLNLALDQDLLQAGNSHSTVNPKLNATPNHNENFTVSEPAAYPPLTKNGSKPSGQPSGGNVENTRHSTTKGLQVTKTQPYLLLSTTLLAINLIFLMLAGIWLSNEHSRVATDQAIGNDPANEQVTHQLASLDEKLLKLEQQFEQLQLSINEQQRLIATSANDATKALQDLSSEQSHFLSRLKSTSAKPITSNVATSEKNYRPVKPAPTKNWHVNLGTFSTREAALRMKKQLDALGHSVQIDNTSFENKAAYRVQLPGFKNRESAERTAKQIMDKTKLNGLWAWKDE